MMKKKNILRLIVSILIPQLVGLLGAFFTSLSLSTWYESLNKPFFTPPKEVFGPVWTILYLLMGISLYLIWKKDLKKNEVKLAVIIFAIQLFHNHLWSIVFFGLQSPFLGLIVIIILWITIILTIYKFYQLSLLAACLLIPYLLWVTYAVILNLFIVFMN